MDDIALLVAVDDEYNMLAKANQDLQVIDTWTRNNNLTLAPEKKPNP